MRFARTIHNNINKIASKSSYFDSGEAIGLGRAPGKLQKRLKSPSVEIASASWDQVSKVDKKLKILLQMLKEMQNPCHFDLQMIVKNGRGLWLSFVNIDLFEEIIIRKLHQKEMMKKVHGPTTTLAGIARRGVFVRPGRCSCLQVSKKKTKTGTTFLSACCF